MASFTIMWVVCHYIYTGGLISHLLRVVSANSFPPSQMLTLYKNLVLLHVWSVPPTSEGCPLTHTTFINKAAALKIFVWWTSFLTLHRSVQFFFFFLLSFAIIFVMTVLPHLLTTCLLPSCDFAIYTQDFLFDVTIFVRLANPYVSTLSFLSLLNFGKLPSFSIPPLPWHGALQQRNGIMTLTAYIGHTSFATFFYYIFYG